MSIITDFDTVLFEQKLTNLKDTQEGIQQMSSWCLQQRAHHKKIVSSWLNVLKQVRVEHRLTLFYLANDVIQYSKRKNYEFVESWGTTLQKATTMVRDEKVRTKIFRIFKIWEQRGIYSEECLSDLNGLLSMNPVKKVQPQSGCDPGEEFQNLILVTNIKDCGRLEGCTDKSFKNLPKVPNCDIETIKNTLKDRSRSEDVEKEIDDFVAALEIYVKNLKAEIKSRNVLITTLEQAETFYTTQRGEVKVVVNAYKNFGNRIKVMKKKLEEIVPNLPSPIPSPDINAPSPEQDADIVLPDEHSNINVAMFNSTSNGYTSYIDTTLPFDINDFKTDTSTNHYATSSQNMQPIQVINNRLEEKHVRSFEINDFFKSNSNGASYTNHPPLPVPPVSNYPISQSRVDNYSTPSSNYSHIENSYNSVNTPYTSDSSYSTNAVNNNYDRNTIPLIPPPPMPPSLGMQGDDFTSSWDMNMAWDMGTNSSYNHIIDTPTSPPHFERDGVNTNIVEYIDQTCDNEVDSIQDVDHRQLHLPSNIIIALSTGKEKGRSIDIDHRNLISLTGSPGPKQTSKENMTKNNSPPWCSADKDFRPNLDNTFPLTNDKNITISGADKDYRTNYKNKNSLPEEESKHSINLAPLEPPNFAHINDFLTSSSIIDTSMPPPNFVKEGSTSKLKNFDFQILKLAGKTNAIKGSGINDNVESIDMEMSDEDLEDFIIDDASLSEGTEDPAPCNETTAPDFSNPVQHHFRQPLLKTPEFSVNQNWDNLKTMSSSDLLSSNGNREIGVIWKSHRAAGMPFRMPCNQTFSRGGFITQRSFTPQMKHNFRNPFARPRGGAPYFNNRGRGGGTILRGGLHFRGNFRGNVWQ